MPGITRKGIDPSSGHCFTSRASDQGSDNVIVNGISAVRVGDHYPNHTCGDSTHDGTASAGSSTVIINGKSAHRIGDAISCGDTSAAGSSNVMAGNSSFPMLIVVEPGVTLIGGAKTYDDSPPGITAHVRDEVVISPTFPDHREEPTGTTVPHAGLAVSCSNFGDVITTSDMGKKVSRYFLLADCMATNITSSTVGNEQLTANQVACNWVGLCDALLDPIYDQFKFKINSGFRSPAYNAGLIARGYHPSKTSDHLRGCAADLVILKQDGTIDIDKIIELFKWLITSGLPFSQIIFETTWVHVSYNGKDHSNDIFRIAYSLNNGSNILAGGNKGELLPIELIA